MEDYNKAILQALSHLEESETYMEPGQKVEVPSTKKTSSTIAEPPKMGKMLEKVDVLERKIDDLEKEKAKNLKELEQLEKVLSIQVEEFSNVITKTLNQMKSR